MWKVPVTASEALPYVVDAARRERYLGLMVILARTAEARTLHEELVRDWTSIHDVTGQSIAVLCPDPQFVSNEAKKERSYCSLDDIDDDYRSSQTSNYWSRLTLDRARDLPHTQLLIPGQENPTRGLVTPFLSYPKKVQQAAWTEAVSRCAAGFGISERRLPAVLVLCLRDERDVLIQLRPETSIYRLCKRIASHPGFGSGDAGRLDERDELTKLVEQLAIGRGHHARIPVDDPPRTMRRLLAVDKVSAQFEELRKHLDVVADVDPDQNLIWRTGLEELAKTNAGYDAMLAYLSEMAKVSNAHPCSAELLRLNKKVYQVKSAIGAAANPPLEWRYISESQAAKAEREAKRTRAQARLDELNRVLNSRPGLATACETAASAELGVCEMAQLELNEYIALSRHYPTQRIRAVIPIGQPSGDCTNIATRNEISGTIDGIAVQAAHIDAVHFHDRRRFFGIKRKRDRR